MTLPITPETRVAELIETFPEAEDVLIDLAPAFKALRNPVLRRTVARVATLEQAARVGGVPVREMVRILRRAVGQDEGEVGAAPSDGAGDPRPAWVGSGEVATALDAGALLDRGGTPIAAAASALVGMAAGDVLLLSAPFQPAPLIDALRAQGHDVFAEEGGDGSWSVWVRKVSEG